MSNKRVVRNVTMGAALASGVVPLAGVVFNAAEAGPAGDSPAALCKATFGDHGPGGPVVGEGPPGDKMTVTVGWEPRDWPEGLRNVVTCVGLDGSLLQALTRVASQPPNAGNLTVDLMLPQGAPGTLVCQQSILVGKRSTEGRTRTTDAVCFKLRAAENMVVAPDGDGAPPAGSVAVGTQPPAGPRRADEAAKGAAPAPARDAAPPAARMPMTPPARAAFEAARGAARSPAAWRSGVRAPQAKAPAAVTAPVAAPASAPAPAAAPVPATRAGQAADELARTPSGPGLAGGVLRDGASRRSAGAAWTTAASATKARPGTAPATRAANGTGVAGNKAPTRTANAAAAAVQPGNAQPATAQPGTAQAQADAARAALPRTGLGDRIPLAGAGGLLAIGGAAIILGEPRRRTRKV